MREHCSIGKKFTSTPTHWNILVRGPGRGRGHWSRWRREWQKNSNAAFWLLCRSVFGEEIYLVGKLLPYKILVSSLPRSFGQRGYVLLMCCRALRFVLRRTGEFTARRMGRLLHLIVDSLTPFCIYIYCIRACSTPCAWEVISHRYSPCIWIICIINIDPPP